VRVVAAGQSNGDKRDVEEMIGKSLQIGGRQIYDAGIHEDQPCYSADEAPGKKKSLKEKNLGPQKNADEKHACQPAEYQHGFKGKWVCHIGFSSTLILFSKAAGPRIAGVNRIGDRKKPVKLFQAAEASGARGR
jgi:hypothetical protein